MTMSGRTAATGGSGRNLHARLVNRRVHDRVWQIDNTRLETLRLRGGNEICVRDQTADNGEKLAVTEEEILRYCFTQDDDLPVPERRSLRIDWAAAITPAFFEKAVEASKNSQLTCDVQMCLKHLRFDVENLDLGVQPSRSETEYRHSSYLDNVVYDIADHGNAVRLMIHFIHADVYPDGEWKVIVCHGKKDHGKFFEYDYVEEYDYD